jgi:hypothetical protein
VQADHFEKDIQPFMNEMGFSGHYDQKTREAMGQAGKVILLRYVITSHNNFPLD